MAQIENTETGTLTMADLSQIVKVEPEDEVFHETAGSNVICDKISEVVKVKIENAEFQDKGSCFVSWDEQIVNMKVETEEFVNQDSTMVSWDENLQIAKLKVENEKFVYKGTSMVSGYENSQIVTVKMEKPEFEDEYSSMVSRDEKLDIVKVKVENEEHDDRDASFAIQEDISPIINVKMENEAFQDIDAFNVKMEIDKFPDTNADKNQESISHIVKIENMENEGFKVQDTNTANQADILQNTKFETQKGYLMYSEHGPLCEADRESVHAFQKKLSDEVTGTHSFNVFQDIGKVEQDEEMSEVEQQAYQMGHEEDSSHESSDVCEAVNSKNEQIHPIPKLLIKNLHSKCDEDLPVTSEMGLAIIVQCPYCSEVYNQHAPALYIEHLQSHLDTINRKIKWSATAKLLEFEFLKSNLYEHGWKISARVCERKGCNYIYIDLSAKRRHELTMHQHQEFVCQKVGCNMVFPDGGKLRSHEIVDHTKIVHFHPTDTNEVLSSFCDKTKVLAAPAPVSVFSAKLEPQDDKIKMNKRNINNECVYCEKEFPTASELKSHIICAHPVISSRYKIHNKVKSGLNIAREKRTDKYKRKTNDVCADCGIEFPTASKLKSHMICAHPVLSTSSKTNDEVEFKLNGAREDCSKKVPVLTHTYKTDIDYVCADCEKEFPSASELKSHLICAHPVLSSSLQIQDKLYSNRTREDNSDKHLIRSDTGGCHEGSMEERKCDRTNSTKSDNYCFKDDVKNSRTSAKTTRNFADITETIKISAGIVRKFARSSKNIGRKVREIYKRNQDKFAPTAKPYEKNECFETATEGLDMICNLEDGENCKVKHVSNQNSTSVVDTLMTEAKGACDKTGTESDNGNSLGKEENEPLGPDLNSDSGNTDLKTSETDHSFELQNKRIKLDTGDNYGRLSGEQEKFNKINNVRNQEQDKECMEKVEKEYKLHEEVSSQTVNAELDSGEGREPRLEKEKYKTDLFSCTDPTCTRSFATAKGRRVHVAKQHRKVSSSVEQMEISKSLPVSKSSSKRIVAFVPDDVKEALGMKLFGISNQTFSQDEDENNRMSKLTVDSINTSGKPLGNIVNEVEELIMDNADKQCDGTSGEDFASDIFCVCCKLPFESVESKMLHQRQMEEKACFPCKSAGCEVVCLSNEDRKKHVEEAHLIFQPYLVKFRCNFPGCFKGFYRKFDLHDHYGFKICFKDFDRLSEKISSDLNVDITAVKTNLELLGSLTTDELSYVCKYENVEREKGTNANINLVWHVCPLKPCGFGSRRKAAIYEHLRAKHEYMLKKS